VICELRYSEHASSAREDLQEAVETARAMLYEYGMGESLTPPPNALAQLIERLEAETKSLLEGKTAVIDAIVEVLLERESVTKEEIKAKIDALL
jgi:cell division protease FtsH